MKKLSYSPLTLAIASIAMSSVAMAETTTPETTLSVTTVVERQGSKIKTDVVTTETKDESTATDLRGLMQAEPAIDFSGGNGTSSYWTIRGMGQNSIDVKVDNAYSDSQILYHQGRHTLDPSLVKIVAVQKGAGSASSGIGGTNGAIVAKTLDANDLLKGSDKDWGVKVNAGYSSNDEHNYGVTGFAKANNFDFLLSYNVTDQDNYKPGRKTGQKDSSTAVGKYTSPYTAVDANHPSDEVAFQAMDKESYLIKAGYNLGDHRFVLSHFNTTNKGIRNVREEFDYFAGNGGFYRELSMQNTNLEYKGDVTQLGKVEANVYKMKNERYSEYDKGNGYASNVDTPNSTDVETTGINVGFDKYVRDNTLVKYGINYRYQETSPNRTTQTGALQTTEKTDKGIYVEAIHDIGQFTLTGGLRYDHFDYTSVYGTKVSDGTLNPSIGVIYQATPELSFNAVHNYATRSPRLVDALLSAGNRAADIAENTKSEQAKNTEIGFNYNNGNFSADGSYFWQKIDNLLTSGARHQPGDTANKIFNVGHAKNHGFELNTRYKWNNIIARLGVAESNPEYYSNKDASGRNIAFSNREFGSTIGRTWTAGLAYRFANPNLELGINHRKVDDIKGQSAWTTQVTDPRPQVNHDLNLVKYGYNVTDIYANWKPFNNDKMNVNFAINNVGDEYYYSHSAIGGLPGVGREYRVGINYTF